MGVLSAACANSSATSRPARCHRPACRGRRSPAPPARSGVRPARSSATAAPNCSAARAAGGVGAGACERRKLALAEERVESPGEIAELRAWRPASASKPCTSLSGDRLRRPRPSGVVRVLAVQRVHRLVQRRTACELAEGKHQQLAVVVSLASRHTMPKPCSWRCARPAPAPARRRRPEHQALRAALIPLAAAEHRGEERRSSQLRLWRQRRARPAQTDRKMKPCVPLFTPPEPERSGDAATIGPARRRLPLELCKGEEDIEGQPTHRRRGVELLCNGDKEMECASDTSTSLAKSESERVRRSIL